MITRRTITTSNRILHSLQFPTKRIIGRRRNAYGAFVVGGQSSQPVSTHDYSTRPWSQSSLSSAVSTSSLPIQPWIHQQWRGFASIRSDENGDTSIRLKEEGKDSGSTTATTVKKNLSNDTHSEDDGKDKTSSRRKSKDDFKKKGNAASRIQLVQLQELHDKETIRDHFAPLLKQNDVSRLKWVSTLKNQLKNKKINKKNPSSNVYMTHTQTYLQKQSKDIKNAFWELILVNNNKAKRKHTKRESPPLAEHVELLQEVRQAAVEFPILWSVTRKRKMNVQNQERRQDGKPYPWKRYLEERSERLAITHNRKSKEQQKEEARQLAEHLYESMPKPKYDRLIAVLTEHVKACEQDREASKSSSSSKEQKDSKRLKRIQVLYNKIRGPLQRYLHLVAADLGDFLYVTVEDDGITNSRGDIVSDPRISEHSKAFDTLLENFVDSFATIHEFLWNEYQNEKKKLENDDDNENDDDKQLEVGEINLNDDSDEAVLESFQDVMSSGAEATAAKSKKKKIAAKRKPRSYVRFEAINLQDFPASPSARTPILPSSAPALPAFPSNSPNERLVIIDNLPIDVNENMLMDAYSRCGPIESLCVFNRKPYLDPGRRSVDWKKKIRNPSSQREPWRRPRTPLYAMILFSDMESAQRASSDPLRIFGMVLDRHLIRSYSSKDLTKLYLEDIAGIYDVGAIEYELSQILHPELYLCLDIDGDQRATSRRKYHHHHNRKDETSSNCIIQFQDFEAAYWSYLKLTNELSLLGDHEDCALQWMETPKDAMLYWTRKLNF